jgi:hypothetical protein
MRWSHKVVQGLTSALVALIGAKAVLFVMGGRAPDLLSLTLRVGLPAFLAGLVLFPLQRHAISSRRSLAWRVGVASLAVCAVNRVLLLGDFTRLTLTELPAWGARLAPSLSSPDRNTQVHLVAMGSAVLLAALLQPRLWAFMRGDAVVKAQALAGDAAPVSGALAGRLAARSRTVDS